MKRGIQKQLAALQYLFALGMVVSTSSQQLCCSFYTVKVAVINPRSASGDVFVQFDPGVSETRFTKRARGVLLGSDTGTNKVMAEK